MGEKQLWEGRGVFPPKKILKMEFENLKEIEFNEGVRIKVEKGGKGSSGKGGRGVCPARHSTGVDSIDP